MSEFGGLRKHEKTQHALAGLGNAALVAAVVLPMYGGPNVSKGINQVDVCGFQWVWDGWVCYSCLSISFMCIVNL